MMDQQPSGMTSEKLQMFTAGLSGLAADEVRKAKLLLLRNEISQLRAMKKKLLRLWRRPGLFCCDPDLLADPLGTAFGHDCGAVDAD